MGRHCNTTHSSQSFFFGSVPPHFAGSAHSSVRVSVIEKERSCPSVHQDRNQRWVCPHGSARASLSRQALGHIPNTTQWSQHRSSVGFHQNSARSAKKPGQWHHFSPSPAPKQVGNSRATCRGVTDKKRFKVQSFTHDKKVYDRRVRWIWLPDKSDKSFGFAWLCARYEMWSQVGRDEAPCSHQNSTGRLRWKMCRRNDFTSTTTRFVQPQSCCRQWLCDVPKKSRFLRRSLAQPGPWRIFVLLDLHAGSELCFSLGTWTTGICIVLLAA